MVNARDLIHLAYTPDLTAAGIVYAFQQLHSLSGKEAPAAFQELRQMVLNKAVELAFRRFLAKQGVPFSTTPGTAFGRHDPYCLQLRGWHCIIQARWVDQPDIVQMIQSQSESLLSAGAILPSEGIIAWTPGELDLYLFAFVLGPVGEKDIDSHLPSASLSAQHVLKLLPANWVNPRSKEQLAKLAGLIGTAIYLAGYITHSEYARNSHRLQPGDQVFPPAAIKEKTRILHVNQLKPIRELLVPVSPTGL